MTRLLEVKDLEVVFETYLGPVHAVRGIDFHLDLGETIAIVGESGCGKSITAQSLLKLIPMPPGKITKGQAWFQGEDLIAKSEKEMQRIRGKEIGIIFQDPMSSLNPTMKIGLQIMEGVMRHLHLSTHDAREKALEMLQLVGIHDPKARLEQYPHQLSGGMRQRVMIGIALACHPKLLIADEPTTALDATIQAQILELMKELQRKMGMSIVLITHDLGVVAGFCDRVVVMYAGRAVETGTVEQIFSNPSHPYTQALLKSVPRLGLNKKERLTPIMGSPPDLHHPPTGCAFWPRCPYAMQVCKQYQPPLETIDEGHQIACWRHHKHATAEVSK